MSYATQTSLEDAFGVAEILQLADRDRNGVVDPAVMAAVLARADSVIDSYLGGRYATPVSPIPSILTAIACDLARYFLYDDAVPDRVQKAYDDSIAWLKSAARGEVMLIGAAPAAAGAIPGPPDTVAPDRTFTATTLADF